MRNGAKIAAAFALLLVWAVPTLQAWKADIVLRKAASVAETELPAGEYRLDVPDSKDSVSFFQGRKEIVKAPCRVEDLEKAPPGDSVVFRSGADGKPEIVRILLADRKVAIVFKD